MPVATDGDGARKFPTRFLPDLEDFFDLLFFEDFLDLHFFDFELHAVVGCGLTVGSKVGDTVGVLVGASVGDTVGLRVGEAVGEAVGSLVGCIVGALVGCIVGVAVGRLVGGSVVGAGEIVGVSSHLDDFFFFLEDLQLFAFFDDLELFVLLDLVPFLPLAPSGLALKPFRIKSLISPTPLELELFLPFFRTRSPL